MLDQATRAIHIITGDRSEVVIFEGGPDLEGMFAREPKLFVVL